jgi:Predicted membrane protein
MTIPSTDAQSPTETGATSHNLKQAVGVIALLLVIACAISLRFFGLAEKDVWLDECFTLRYIAPTNLAQLQGIAFSNTSLQGLLHPTLETGGLWQTCNNIRENATDQVPLYFLLARFFSPFFNDTLFASRLLSALLSILITPLFYLCVLSVTRSKSTALIGALIVSVSPFLMIYSAEARGYTLWVVLLIVANQFCWEMNRLSGWKASIKYGCVLAALAMSHLASLLIIPGHVVFMLFQGVRKRMILISLLPSAVALLIWNAFQAKLGVAFTQVTSGWTKQLSFGERLDKLSDIGARAFFDSGGSPLIPILALVPIGFLVGGFLVKTNARYRMFCLALLSYPLILIAMDLFFGGVRSVHSRYQTPAFVLLFLQTSVVIGALISCSSKAKKLLGGLLLVSIVLAGVGSEILIARSPRIWSKHQHVDLNRVSLFIKDKKHPLLLCPSIDIAMETSRILPESARLEVFTSEELLTIPSNTDGIIILNCQKAIKLPNLVPRLEKICPGVPISLQDRFAASSPPSR